MRKNILSIPYFFWILIFTILPLILIMFYSITTVDNGEIVISFDNIRLLFTYEFLMSLLYSIILAASSTAICLLISYPFAYILANSKIETRSVLLFLIVTPMWMNFLLKTYAWMAILENTGVINRLLRYLRVLKLLNVSHIQFLYGNGAVVLGMVYNFLPFMILPIYSSLDRMDGSVIEAARDIGANDKLVFRKIIFPLSLQGVLVGVTMVFMPAVTTFVISKMLGGGKTALIGDMIEHEFISVGNWHFGSALSMLLMVVVLTNMSLVMRYDRSHERSGLF